MSFVSFNNDYFVQLATSVKSLGVVLDDGLTFQEHNHKVIGVCYLNLCNMSRIALKFSLSIKIQLIHSLILSHMDYCNPLFYNSPAYLHHKFTEVLNAAVRFVFGLRGFARRSPMLPYLKKFYILPVTFRILIQYKIALLTYCNVAIIIKLTICMESNPAFHNVNCFSYFAAHCWITTLIA